MGNREMAKCGNRGWGAEIGEIENRETGLIEKIAKWGNRGIEKIEKMGNGKYIKSRNADTREMEKWGKWRK